MHPQEPMQGISGPATVSLENFAAFLQVSPGEAPTEAWIELV
jgi:hypothetical protein